MDAVFSHICFSPLNCAISLALNGSPPPTFPPLLPSVVFFVCLASNSPIPSWAPFMKMQIHSRAGENVNRRKLLRSTNQKRRAKKNRQQQPGDPNSVQPPPEIATHACINPLQAKNMWLKERCCHLLQGTTPLLEKRTVCHCLLALSEVWLTLAKYCLLIFGLMYKSVPHRWFSVPASSVLAFLAPSVSLWTPPQEMPRLSRSSQCNTKWINLVGPGTKKKKKWNKKRSTQVQEHKGYTS